MMETIKNGNGIFFFRPNSFSFGKADHWPMLLSYSVNAKDRFVISVFSEIRENINILLPKTNFFSEFRESKGHLRLELLPAGCVHLYFCFFSLFFFPLKCKLKFNLESSGILRRFTMVREEDQLWQQVRVLCTDANIHSHVYLIEIIHIIHFYVGLDGY